MPVCAASRRIDDLNFVNDMLVELCVIARKQRLDLLVYFIDMAHFEAADQMKRMSGDKLTLPESTPANLTALSMQPSK